MSSPSAPRGQWTERSSAPRPASWEAPSKLVQLQVAREGRQAVCVVRDRGIGIPEADREWLFTAFHRGGNVADRPGSGLGLVIVKRCVDLHGGGLEIFQKLGVETRSAATLRGLEVLACRK